MILFLVGGLAPTYTPFITFALTGTKNDFKEYKQRLFKFKVKIIWYVFALMMPFIIYLLSFSVTLLFDVNADFTANLQTWYMIFPIFLMMIVGGGLEELGWRGLMLPELQKKINATYSSIIVGIVWALWHLPLFFIIGVSQYQGNFYLFALSTIMYSFLLTWFFNNTKSIVISVVFHAMLNATVEMGFGNWSDTVSSSYIKIGVMAVVVLIIISIFGYKTFTRNKKINLK